MAFVEIIPLSRCRKGGAAFVELADRPLAVFLLTDPERVVVIDDHCPHAGGSLSAGDIAGNEVSCPWHHWEFNLDTGACKDPPGARLRRYPAEIRDDAVWADLDGEPSFPGWR